MTNKNTIIVCFFVEVDANQRSKRELFPQSNIYSLPNSNQKYNNCLFLRRSGCQSAIKERTNSSIHQPSNISSLRDSNQEYNYCFSRSDQRENSFRNPFARAINNPYISSLRDSNQEYNNCLYRSKRDVKERTKIPDLISSPIRRFMGHIPIPHKRMMRDHIAYHTCNIARHIPRP
jgi:hypothetical protein